MVDQLQKALIVCMENTLARKQLNEIDVLVVVLNVEEMGHMETNILCWGAQNVKSICASHHALKYIIPEVIIGNMHQSNEFVKFETDL